MSRTKVEITTYNKFIQSKQDSISHNDYEC